VEEVVTLLHGFTLTGASWDELVAKMPAGWKWMAPDLRGHGNARAAPCTMDECAADLVALWDHLGVERSHVVGYSMGGRLALHLAVRLPDRVASLFTIGAHAGFEGDARQARRRADEALAERIEREGLERFVDSWEALPMFAGVARRGAGFSAWLHGLRLTNQAAGLAASLRGMGAGAMEPLWEPLGKIAIPSTFVAGDQDSAFIRFGRRLAESVDGSRLRIIVDSGHAAHFEKPDETASVLADHLGWAASATSSATTA
jgi:2-succinyl-6-hydroxy-2,4-cyclohexadiene-1-carboxylate synthase